MKNILFVAAFFLLSTHSGFAQNESTIVRTVFFYSPACQYCTETKQYEMPKWFKVPMDSVKQFYASDPTVLPSNMIPWELKKGGGLELLMINILTQQGDSVWKAVSKQFGIPGSKRKIPMLIIENQVIVGSSIIAKSYLPLVRKGREGGGVDWPKSEPIQNVLKKIAAFDNGAGFALQPPPKEPFLTYAVKNPTAVVLSSAVLLWLLIQVGLSAQAVSKKSFRLKPKNISKTLLFLGLAGMFIAGYLSWSHLTNTDLACGSISDCDKVNGSRYALLFGFFPVAYLGSAGYVVLTVLVHLSGKQKSDQYWKLLQLLSGVAVLISAGLIATALFVIQGMCIWCLGSALVVSEFHRRVR